jgi:hypothetical protein
MAATVVAGMAAVAMEAVIAAAGAAAVGGGAAVGVRIWGPDYYYNEPGDCGWVRVRVLRNGHWVVRRVWRCW